MSNIIVFGTGRAYDLFKPLIRSDCNIIAFSDNDQQKWRQLKNGILIIPPSEILEHDYDYIVIASQYDKDIYDGLVQLGIPKEKIFMYVFWGETFADRLTEKYKSFIERQNNIEGFITGISYAYNGIDPSYFKHEIMNFSSPSQDLYYDYQIAKKLVTSSKTIKYAIISLCYYSFQYDLSLSAMKSKVLRFYQFLGDYHHYSDVLMLKNLYAHNELLADKLICNSKLATTPRENSEKKLNRELGIKQAQLDCNKNYPRTVEENKQILKDYLVFLKSNQVRPIIVVLPATKYYTECFSIELEAQFKKTINELKQDYEFQYIDLFRSTLFHDTDFVDVSHLNRNGAKKCTNLLQDLIDWSV